MYLKLVKNVSVHQGLDAQGKCWNYFIVAKGCHPTPTPSIVMGKLWGEEKKRLGCKFPYQ